MRLIVLLFLLAPTFLAGALAAHTPAKLLEGDRSIEAQLRLPKELPLGKYEVYCEALILKSGRAEEFICYSMPGSDFDKLIDAVARAGRKARFAPATRDGKPVDVYMVLMVYVRVTNDGPLVLAVPNNGVDAARYGLLYTAPQRFNEFYWSDDVALLRDIQRDVLIWQHLEIDERGKITAFELTNASKAPKHVMRLIEEQIGRMEFMPGFVEGKPMPMLYMEPAFGDSY